MDTCRKDSLSRRGQDTSHTWQVATKGILAEETDVQNLKEVVVYLANSKTFVWLEHRISERNREKTY